MFRLLRILTLFALFTGPANAQQIEGFRTGSGICNIEEKRALENLTALSAESYITKDTFLNQRRGASPTTGRIIPSSEPVYCLARQGNTILVTGITTDYCGWVHESDLKNVESSSESAFSTNQNLAPCGQIQSMSLKNFCEKASSFENIKTQHQELFETCKIESVKGSQTKTKFFPYNKIDFFSTIGGTPKKSDTTYSVLEVYDVEEGENGEVHVLLGAGGNRVLGWTKLNNGQIWYFRLSAYFKPQGKKPVYSERITNSNNDNRILVAKPKSPDFKISEDFAKFPILLDLRASDRMEAQGQPQLKIAVPGEFDQEQIMVTGFIETASIGRQEDHWDYFVSVNANELDGLRDATSRVCRTLGKSGTERRTAEESLCAFVDIMTGDKTDGARCVAIVSGGSIPLVSETILGDGLLPFLRAVQQNENLSVYKKEFCRSSLLTELMQKNYKLSKPEEGQGLLWEGNYFSPVDPEKFKWEYGDTLGNQTYFLPLDYLPRPIK